MNNPANDAGTGAGRLTMIDQERLHDLTESYLKSVISEAADSVKQDFDSLAAFGELGISSFQVLKIIRKLEDDFGTLPKTLLFENFNVDDLAKYFVEKHEAILIAKFAANLGGAVVHSGRRQPEPAEARLRAARSTPAVPESAPLLILERDAYAHPELKNLVQALFTRHKIEGSVSRGTRKIAPNLFIGSERRGYFNYGRCKNMLVVYAYTGPRDNLPALLEEMVRHCAAKNLQLNVLGDRQIPPAGGTSFSATPFGALQRIVNLKEFTIGGGPMRRLRYQVSKFQKSGACRTQEYRCGSDPETDQKIVAVIDRWCETRTVVNPLVRDVRAEILAGTFSAEHRVFLTELDGVLQNVIVITAMCAEENGYLMDLEFYLPEMPLGGLEFAIVQIIDVLVREKCDVLSLGGTFGCKIESSPSADPEVDKILDDLREQNIFNDAGNLQFKNKFCPDNKAIFLCRPVGSSNPGSVIDVIMMIADPENTQTSDKENHNGMTVPSRPVASMETPQRPAATTSEPARTRRGGLAMEGVDRSRILAEHGFNPLKIPHENVELDLKTDSWAQLEMPGITAQMRHLHAQLLQAAGVNESLKAVFPFAHFVLTPSGQTAEHIFFKAWPKKGIVPQNLLFPTTILHQIDNGLSPRELPHPSVFHLNAEEPYKGDIDWKALQALVALDPAALSCVCIEVSDNAAGGSPVSIRHLLDVKSLLAGHGIPLVLDVTRVVENAQFLIEREKDYEGKSMWTAVRDILSCADAVIGSLTKDFCVNKGGIIATNDAGLFHRMEELVQEEGCGLDLIDRKLIAVSLQNRRHIGAAVLRRMEHVRLLWQALKDRAVPVVQPAGGHCVLIDVRQIAEFKDLGDPVASFLAWLYVNTGTRAGAHSAGMQKHTAINDLARLAIPVGLMREEIGSVIGRLSEAFEKIVNIPEVVMASNAPQPLGGVYADYQLIQYHNAPQTVVTKTDAASDAQPMPAPQDLAAFRSNTTTSETAVEQGERAPAAARSMPRGAGDVAVIGMAGRYPKAKNDVDQFDSQFFNISPSEAEILDPRERMLLEVAWEALEDAGYYPEILAQDDGPRNIGVFLGAVSATYQTPGVEGKHAGDHIVPSSFLRSIANRVSDAFDLSGPSLTIDTAGSSSLTALHLACEAIQAGGCSAAIVGGVNPDLHEGTYDINDPGGASSADGNGANCHVMEESIGALILKPLDRAALDGDNILGVIRSATVNYGGRTSANTVPNIENPEAAAGIVSVSKALLQMKHRRLVASLNSAEANELIDLGHSASYVAQTLEQWSSEEVDGVRLPIRAGISSFGAGGSNAHVIVESYEPPQTDREAEQAGLLIFPLSARNEDQLREAAVRLTAFLRQNEVDIKDAAYTLQQGRKSFEYRLAVIAGSKEELIERLTSFIAGQKAQGAVTGHANAGEAMTRFLGRREEQEFSRILSQGTDPQRLAALWAEGLLVDWQGLQRAGARKRISLPTYPFADKRHQASGSAPVLAALQPTAGLDPKLDETGTIHVGIEESVGVSVAEIAGFVANAGTSEIPPGQPSDKAQFRRLPLSFAQERLWFLNELVPNSAGYSIPGAVTIAGELDISQYEQALSFIIVRHEILRTVFPSEEGRACQRILEGVDFKLVRIDLSGIQGAEDRNVAARQLCQAETEMPFDLAKGPLIRGQVIKLDEHEHILMLNMHHIISDGWSIGVLLREMGVIMDAIREGREPQLAPLPIQYADYSIWQRQWLEEGGKLQQQLAYWQEKLTGIPESLDLATDYPRPGVQSFAGATHAFAVDGRLTGQLKRLAEQRGVTLYMVLLAAFKTLLHRYTGQTDICVGSPIANRQYEETEGLIGMFVNTLVLRSQVVREDPFVALLSKVKATCLEAYEHQDAPFEKVVDVVRPQRNMAISPLFQVMLVLQNAGTGALDPAVQRYPLERGVSTFDLTLEFTETGEGLAGSVEYCTALYKPETIQRMVEHFTALCQAISTAPSTRIGDLEYLGEAEKHRLLTDFNDTHAEYPANSCVHELIAEQAAVTPDRAAVVCGDEQLTYQELHARSGDLALYLQSQGVKPDDLAGLCMERSLDMVVGLLGILHAGGAYVPLDPNYPDERLAYMLRDSGPSIVLTQEKSRDRLTALVPADARLLSLDLEWPAIRDRVAALRATGVCLEQIVKPHDLAYVIYTSGSTGQPKGVMVPHRALVNHASYFAKRLGLSSTDRVLQFASLSFDTAAEEIFPTWLTGACLVLRADGPPAAPSDFFDIMEASGVTVLDLPTVYWHELADYVADSGGRTVPSSIRAVVIGGEAASAERFEKWRRVAGDRLLLNTYGPTEATIIATAYEPVEAGVSCGVLPIGRPISNAYTYVLDERRQPVPMGIAGELYIGGAGVTRGYLRRPELTEDRFMANPFRGEPGERLYRTGDRARYRSDGVLEFLGRADDQVKIRGFRIEPGEIEAALRKHPAVRDAVVLAREDKPGHRRLIAYVVSHGGETLPAGELRAALSVSLPDFMIPAAFVPLEAIPKLPNGKLDRRALASMDVTIESGQVYVAPRNETERRLAGIWAGVLSLAPEKIGVNDNFFELGGHSLLATQLISKIRSQLEIDVPLKALFERASIAQFAELIATANKSGIPPIRPIDRAGFGRLPLSFAQERLWFINQLDPDSAGYNIPGTVAIRGELDINQLEQAFNLIIARHENLRTVFPSEEGQAYQQIVDRVDFRLERIDLSRYDRDARDIRAKQICHTDAAMPFDLAKGPLLRGRVIKLSEHEHILMLNMHHIISDGWSTGILIREIGVIMDAIREGREPELAPLPIQYADYSVWQREWLDEGGVLEQQLAYWQEKLAGVPESLDLATDYPRPSAKSFAGATHAFAVDARLTGQLKRLAEQQGGTLYMALLAAFNVLLHRYTGQSDLCVGSPIANRQYGETEGLIGMFVNILALRNHVDGADTFATLLGKVKNTCLGAYENQDAPFEKVVDLVRPQRNMAISPLFQVMLILQNVDMGSTAPDQRIESYALDSNISKFDLTFEFTETPEGLAGSIEYSSALYKPRTIARMVEHFIGLCRAITAAPTAKIQDLEYLGEAAKRRLLVDFNATQADYPQDKCIHDFFIEQVRLDPGKTAVACGDEKLSYQELYDRSRDLALYLQSQGVGPDSIVGLCLERSVEMMVGIMGTVLAGGAYMPLDPDYPDERLAYMLADSNAAVVLTQAKWASRIGALSEAVVVALDTQWSEVLKCRNNELRREVTPRNLCYVIYTSGSTGKPKGVLNEHGALVNRLHWMQKSYPLTGSDVVLQKTPYSFDVSVWEFFWPMMTGASIVFAAPGGHKDAGYLEELINEAKVTTLHYVPSMLYTFLENARGTCGSVRQLFCSGEALDRIAVDRYKTRFPNAGLHNLYGPTEAAIDVTSFDCSTLTEAFVPIGTPIDNIRIYILDSHNQPQPIGVPGELHIAGDGLARGYLNRPELTQAKFVSNPFAPGARMYKTGDLARWLDDGNVQYLGRIDTQVKIRGFRIELGEIEARLNQHPQVGDSAVIARGEGADKQLIAFYRAKETATVSSDELRAHLQLTLPEYMVPPAFVSVAAIPLSSNGKVDRRALAGMDVTMASGRAYVAPRTETERQLVAIWAEVLKQAPERIGVHDNFFDLGGHSLSATRLISKIRSQFSVDLPLKAVFEGGSVAQLARSFIKAEKTGIPLILPVDRTQLERLPLSFAQERLWFLSQLAPNTAGYNIPGAVKIRGAMDIAQVEDAFNVIIARHENLRTVFPSDEGQAHQKILDAIDFKLARIDLSGYDGDARDAEASRLSQSEAETPFDLATGPLIRGMVIKLGEDEHILMLNLHHIISDGWSHGVLIRELGAVMAAASEGRRSELPPLPIQYADYSVWQRRWLEEGGVLERQLGYWREKLAGVPESLALPTDFPRPGVQTYAGASHPFVFDAELTAQLKHIAEQHGGTLYMVLLAAFKVLLYRYTGQSDLCMGSPIANRQYGETEGLIGMFVNTLAMRSQVEESDSFAALLAKVKTTCLEAYEHQDAPFERVVDSLHLQRNLGITPLFQVMVVLQNAPMGALGDDVQPYPLESGISKFDLTLFLTEGAEGLAGGIEYRTALYRHETIERMAGHFRALCRAIVAAPAMNISRLHYMDEAETRQLLVDFNRTDHEYPRDKCIHELFIERVAIDPERTAVLFGGQKLSYGQLHDRSRALALHLQSLGVKPDSLVALYAERSLDLVVGILGILQAGGACLPLDPRSPDERVADVLRDSQADTVLVQKGLDEARSNVLASNGSRLIALDGSWSWGASVKRELLREAGPHNLAYVIYTSGSTGRPKGVSLTHTTLTNLMSWQSEEIGFREGENILNFTEPTFDVFMQELFTCLAAGCAFVIPDAATRNDPALLGRFIVQNDVHTIFLPYVALTSLLDVLTTDHDRVPLKTIITAGEQLAINDNIRQFFGKHPGVRLHNHYGPSETHVVTAYALPEHAETWSLFPSIGAPISNTRIYILDRHNQPQPMGVPGELHIAGEGLARGYLNRPELTERKFVANPFEPGARMYKTGDMARWLDDGTLQYLGRIDTQVKVRGFRIELGEIEARLGQHPRIQDSAVIAQGEGANKQIIAFYRAKETTADEIVELPNEDLRAHLHLTLPEYMVPAAFVSVAAIPLSSNGKVDRRALARMDVTMASGRAYVAPRTETERQLVAIWAEVLKQAPERIGVHDNFFDLGGHSLSAVQLMAKANRHFKQVLPLAVLFTAPDVAALAKLISSEQAPSFDILVPIQPNGDAPPVFAVPGAGGNVLSLRPLSESLGNQQPLFALQAVGLDGKTPPLGSVEQTARVNIAALKTVQPSGPYRLVGHSYGGVVAYEMARILLEQGEEIASLILLDSLAPSVMQENAVYDEVVDLVEACQAVAALNGARLEIDVEELRRSTFEERVQYLAGMLTYRGLEINSEQFTAFHRVYQANLLCYRTYRPSLLPRTIDVSLYRATQGRSDRLSLPRDYGWDELLQSPIRTSDVQADHFSILTRVPIREMGGAVHASIAAASDVPSGARAT